MSDVLIAHEVSWRQGGRNIVEGVNVDFPAGQVTAVVGPNGAGKTSLLRLLSGEIIPGDGWISINGKRLADVPLLERAELRSVMTQSSRVVFDFLVEEILSMGWLHRDSVRFADALNWVIHACHIDAFIGRQFNSLSGGEQQRVQFARALLQICPEFSDGLSGRYLLLDEPSASLDVAHELTVFGLMRQAAAHGVGVAVVMHDLNLASRFADQLILMQRGRVIRQGPTESVLQAETLSAVYDTPMRVERHAELDRLVVYS